MKNYDEITNSLLERRDRYVAERKQKRKRMIRTVTPLCCLCLAALLGVGIWQGGWFRAEPPITLGDSVVIGEKDYISPDELDSSKTDLPSEQNDPARIMWTVNRVEGTTSAAKLNFASDQYYSETKDIAAVAEYLGKDLTSLGSVLPQGFDFVGRYETEFFYENGGKLAYDTCVFGYEKDSQQINILVSKIGAPYDCVYHMTDPATSLLNGVEVTMGGICKDDNSEGFELIFADFSHEGSQYRVTVENVPYDGIKDMYGWLTGIIVEITK